MFKEWKIFFSLHDYGVGPSTQNSTQNSGQYRTVSKAEQWNGFVCLFVFVPVVFVVVYSSLTLSSPLASVDHQGASMVDVNTDSLDPMFTHPTEVFSVFT